MYCVHICIYSVAVSVLACVPASEDLFMMENYSDLDGKGSGLELLQVADVLDYLGISDPALRKLTREQPASDSSDIFSKESVYLAMIGGIVVVVLVLIIILLVGLVSIRR